jgi:hypothetical protein
MRGAFSVLKAAALALFLVACASQMPFVNPLQHYPGPARPNSETATVFSIAYGPAGYAGLHGFIDGVDGRRITLTRAAPLEIDLLPGEHTFDMVAGDGSARRADGVVTVVAEAGHTYEIVATREGPDNIVWSVVDRGVGFRRTDIVYRDAVQRGFVAE